MSFDQFNLHPDLMKGIMELGFAEPTPVQYQVIPEALKGLDIRASAQTGTGKTCAFVIPIINKLINHPAPGKPNVLIVLPTRELAAQVMEVIHDIGKHAKIKSVLILGGENFDRQETHIEHSISFIEHHGVDKLQ